MRVFNLLRRVYCFIIGHRWEPLEDTGIDICDRCALGRNTPEVPHHWKAIRAHGGGTLETYHPMTEAEAIRWVSEMIQGEILFIDRECGFIFYRSKE